MRARDRGAHIVRKNLESKYVMCGIGRRCRRYYVVVSKYVRESWPEIKAERRPLQTPNPIVNRWSTLINKFLFADSSRYALILTVDRLRIKELDAKIVLDYIKINPVYFVVLDITYLCDYNKIDFTLFSYLLFHDVLFVQ